VTPISLPPALEVAEVLAEVRKTLPFELLGFDTDNDGVFLNETVREYCQTGQSSTFARTQRPPFVGLRQSRRAP
jgi:hypothetical protein